MSHRKPKYKNTSRRKVIPGSIRYQGCDPDYRQYYLDIWVNFTDEGEKTESLYNLYKSKYKATLMQDIGNNLHKYKNE